MGFLGVAAVAVFWGRSDSLSRAKAEPPSQPSREAASSPIAATPPSDYSQRVVAYIYGTIGITREELGEYLIARVGADRLTNLVNKRIIEHVCRQKGIEVTAAEVEADFQETIKGLGPGVTIKEFVNQVLKPRNKTLYEWKEDVVKPRILLSKLSRDRVQVTDEDLQLAFEAHYGEKVDCRIILWPKGENQIALNMYGKLRDSEEEFDRASRMQAHPNLAATGGHISPIGRNTTGNEAMERAAFSLHKGEISQLIETPDGTVVLKCIDRIPPDKSKTLEQVRGTLYKEVFDKKLQAEIPKVFNELRVQADPKFILKDGITEEELLREVHKELQSGAEKPGVKTPSPGN
jgi:hypothetical protein